MRFDLEEISAVCALHPLIMNRSFHASRCLRGIGSTTRCANGLVVQTVHRSTPVTIALAIGHDPEPRFAEKGSSMIRYVGIDLHKRLLVACIVDEQGNVVATPRIEEVTRASVEQFCNEYLRSEDEVVLEVTTHVWAVVRLIQPHVSKVVVSNPITTKAIADAKIKTDKVDATVLAHLLRLDFLPTVWAPDEALSKLRELTSRRSRLVGTRTKLCNRIRTCLAMRLLDCPHDIPSAKGREWLQQVELDEDARHLVDSDLRLLDGVEQELAFLDKRLAQRVYEDKRVKLLMTLPGVSQNVAQAVVASIGEIDRFASPEKLASYFGLIPSTRQSASKCYHGNITKAGRVEARVALVQAAQCVRTDLGPLGYYFNKIKRRKCHNVAVVAVARKLAILCWHMLKTGLPYRYAKPTSVEAKLSKLRVAGSGQKRKSGVAKGQDPRTMRTKEEQHFKWTPALSTVLAKEGLDPPSAPKAGELKVLQNTKTMAYFESLQQETKRARRQKKATPETARSTATPISSIDEWKG